MQLQHAVCATNVPHIFTPSHSKALLLAHFAVSCELDDEGGDEACGGCRDELYGCLPWLSIWLGEGLVFACGKKVLFPVMVKAAIVETSKQ